MTNEIKIYDTLIQGTPEWLEARRCLITASVVKQLLTKKFAISKAENTKMLAFELASQRITGRVQFTPESYDMRRGTLEEPIARKLYEDNYNPVKEVGFMERGFLGFSPDGLVGEDGFIEIKSRQNKFQVKTFFEDEVPGEYMCQIQMGFIVSGRKWCDFIQYSNGMPLFVKRVYPNLELIDTIKEATNDLELQIKCIVEDYTRSIEGFPMAEYIEDIFSEEVDFSGITED